MYIVIVVCVLNDYLVVSLLINELNDLIVYNCFIYNKYNIW